MDLFFKVHAYGLIIFDIWMIYTFAKEWKDNYAISNRKG